MLQHILWGITFFSLWLTIIWLHYLFEEEPRKKELKEKPTITLAIPAFNEEKTIAKTVQSIIQSDYPADKIEIIIVDDCSKDNTSRKAEELIAQNPAYKIRLLRHEQNKGKAAAVNTALDNATGEYFAVVDADSRIAPDGIKLVLPYFYDEKIGAVISRVKVESPSKLIERIQYFEYIMSSMIRKLMAMLGTLHITPGVLSTYKTEVVRKVGGFTKDRNNLTEDMEIALRLIANGYRIEMQPESVTHTIVPKGLSRLWKQRIRWARGYIYNMWLYRRLMLSAKHGTFGLFQMPINIIVVTMLILNVGIIMINILDRSSEFLLRSATIQGYFIQRILDFPAIHTFVLGQNYRIMLPIIIVTILGFYLIWQSHRRFKESMLKNATGIIAYFFFIPYFTTVNWIASIFQEVMNTKRKW